MPTSVQPNVFHPMPNDQSPGFAQVASQKRTLVLAWLLLWLAFATFCLLVGWVGFQGWHLYTTATRDEQGVLIVRGGPVEWAEWKRRERTTFERVRDQQELKNGDRVRVTSTAGYGQVVTVRMFDQSTLDMWANADLTIEQMQTSLWTQAEQLVELRQRDGYIRYDVRTGQPYAHVRYIVHVGVTQVVLAPGGSYSIGFVASDRRLFALAARSVPMVMIDLAVRAGSAEVQSGSQRVTLTAGEQTLIDPVGSVGEPQAATWELIRDGTFMRYSEAAYNNTTIPNQPTLTRATTWRVYGVPPGTGASGLFRLSPICPPPQVELLCPNDRWQHAAWFIRTGNQTRGFTTGIEQGLGVAGLGVDISEYRSLVFTAWVNILEQSIPLTGDQGTECPVMIRFLGKRSTPTDAEQERVICFYTNTDGVKRREWPNVTYYEIAPYQWYQLHIDLRDATWMPDYRFLRGIQIYANGHDYNARVASISLVGTQ